ncbi:type II toxin-antitoxin system YoeB family toxin [Salmonella enterica]|nr:type II toxin-antitoxin system YoeB family toxin [Salmonella enterica]
MTEEHRLVYAVTYDALMIAVCQYYYPYYVGSVQIY